MLRPAVFLDRDGTLNVERSFITDPGDLHLLPGVHIALRELRLAGFVCVVVTNQSAVGRGLMTHGELASVQEELVRQLGSLGAALDGIYACTATPAADGEPEHPERKPAPGLLLRAAQELQLDLARSWMIGDSMRDIQAGQNAGCRGCILVRSGHPVDELQHVLAEPFAIAEDLLSAARLILATP